MRSASADRRRAESDFGPRNGEDHAPEIPHSLRSACQPPFPADDLGAAPSAPLPWSAREAEVTSHRGVVADSANPDVVLVGGGIMSATLAALFGVVAPRLDVTVFESGRASPARAPTPGTTPAPGTPRLRAELHPRRARRPGRPREGRHDQRAVPGVAAVLVAPRARGHDRLAQGVHHPGPARQLRAPATTAARYMRARHAALAAEPLFAGLEYADDPAELAEWIPLMMAGPRPAAGRRRHPLGRRHGRQLRHPHPADARRRGRPRRRGPPQPARAATSSARPTAAGA